MIENISLQIGMPKGGLALADDLGLRLVVRYENQAAENYGTKYIQHPAVSTLNKMLEELDRSGRTKKAGFYAYPEDGERYLWPELKEHFPETKPTYSREEITERIFFAQVIEAVWCMQEKVINSVPAANLGRPWRAGPQKPEREGKTNVAAA